MKKEQLSIQDLLDYSKRLWEQNCDRWEPMEASYGRNSILYMIEEVGEVISIIKKKGEQGIMEDACVREHFIEELTDVIMYFSDALNRYQVTEQEFANAYRKKMHKNLGRDYRGEYKKLYITD